MRRLVAVFGGTFDPVHCGHLRTLLELHELLGADRTLVIPCGDPPHRSAPVADAAARRRMVEVAIAGLDGIEVDGREIARAGPSWTVDTLESLRRELPDESLCLLVGADAFAGIGRWNRWESLFELAHIVVARRGGIPEPPIPPSLAARVVPMVALRDTTHGGISYCETSRLEISSSRVRSLAAEGRSLRWLVPGEVEDLIEENGWYRSER